MLDHFGNPGYVREGLDSMTMTSDFRSSFWFQQEPKESRSCVRVYLGDFSQESSIWHLYSLGSCRSQKDDGRRSNLWVDFRKLTSLLHYTHLSVQVNCLGMACPAQAARNWIWMIDKEETDTPMFYILISMLRAVLRPFNCTCKKSSAFARVISN